MNQFLIGMHLSELLGVYRGLCPGCSAVILEVQVFEKHLETDQQILLQNQPLVACSHCRQLLYLFAGGARKASLPIFCNGLPQTLTPRDKKPDVPNAEFIYHLAEDQLSTKQACFVCLQDPELTPHVGIEFILATPSSQNRLLEWGYPRISCAAESYILSSGLYACKKHYQELRLLSAQLFKTGFVSKEIIELCLPIGIELVSPTQKNKGSFVSFEPVLV